MHGLPLPRPFLVWLALAAAALVALGAQAFALSSAGTTHEVATAAAWLLVGGLASGTMLAAGLRVRDRRVRLAWLLWSAGAGLWTAGAGLRLGLELAGLDRIDWLADPLWLAFPVLALAGLAFRAPEGRFSFRLLVLDAVPVALLVAGIAELTHGGLFQSEHPSRLGLYVIPYALLAMVALQFLPLIRTISMATVGGGFAVLTAAALLWPSDVHGTSAPSNPAELLWTLGLLLLALAGVRRALAPGGVRQLTRLDRENAARAVLPAAAIVALTVAHGFAPPDHRRLLLWILLAAISAFAVRFWLVRREGGRLMAELVRSQRSLHESEARFRVVFEHAGIGIALTEMDARPIESNVALQEMLGYTAEELRAIPLGDLALETNVGARFLRELAGSGRDWASAERRYQRKDGSIVHANMTASIVRDEAGEPQFAVATVEDVTEQKRAEERFRTLVANVPGAVYRCAYDRERTLELVSGAIAEIAGYPPAHFLEDPRHGYDSVVHADDRARVRGGLVEALDRDRPYTLEYRVVRADGSVRWVYEKGQAARDPGGSVLWLDGVLLDVTERREAAERAREAEAKYRRLVETLPLATFIADADAAGRMLYMSPQVEELLGYPVESWREREGLFWDLIHPDDGAMLRASLARGKSPPVEFRLTARDGREVWVHGERDVVHDAEGRPLFAQGFLFDITPLKRAEAEREQHFAAERAARAEAESAQRLLAEQNDRLRELDRLKDEFVALVSHELRTPLTSIMGYLELLRDGEAGELGDEAQSFLAVIDRSAERLLRLVSDLLFVAQVEAGKLMLAPEELDLVALARESVESAAPVAAQKEIALELAAEALPPFCGDRVRLAQLLDNLVANALKFTPAGGRVEMRVFGDGERAVLEVADDGIGIPEEELSRLFERFNRAGAAGEHRIQGTGLGLTIVKAIVGAHGGTIEATSEEGRGTTFRVELPFRDRARPEESADPVEAAR